MSAKKPLTCQSRKVDIVIRKNKSIPIEKIKAYCQKEFERYAFIEATSSRCNEEKNQI